MEKTCSQHEIKLKNLNMKPSCETLFRTENTFSPYSIINQHTTPEEEDIHMCNTATVYSINLSKEATARSKIGAIVYLFWLIAYSAGENRTYR